MFAAIQLFNITLDSNPPIKKKTREDLGPASFQQRKTALWLLQFEFFSPISWRAGGRMLSRCKFDFLKGKRSGKRGGGQLAFPSLICSF